MKDSFWVFIAILVALLFTGCKTADEAWCDYLNRCSEITEEDFDKCLEVAREKSKIELDYGGCASEYWKMMGCVADIIDSASCDETPVTDNAPECAALEKEYAVCVAYNLVGF